MLTERTFDTGNVTINYAAGSAGGPLLVLLHGVTVRWQDFLPVVPVLAQRWRVVAVDHRGHGRSGRVPNRYGLMDYASDVAALLQHLGGEPAVLVGHSLGAMVTIGVASEAPEAVRAVVLEDPPLGAFSGQPFARRPENARFIATRDLARTGRSAAELVPVLAGQMPDRDAAALRSRARAISQLDPDALTAIVETRAIDGYDLGDRLSRVACPALLLQGNAELGGAMSDDEARWAASLLPDCAHVYLPNVGHLIHGEQPVAFGQIVTGFLESL